MVEVEWAPSASSVFLVAIQVEALDRTRLLSDVTRVLSDQHVNILSATVTTSRDRVAFSRFTFEMGDPEHLRHVLRAVRTIETGVKNFVFSSTAAVYGTFVAIFAAMVWLAPSRAVTLIGGAGLPATALAAAARKHADRMAQQDALSHQFPGEPSLPSRVRQTGARFVWLSENVALGPNPSFIHTEFVQSPQHRANLLDADMNEIGIGLVARNGRWFAVEDFSKAK